MSLKTPVDAERHVLTEVRGGVGWITLNRPKALNALSLDMVRDLASSLRSWVDDPAVHGVVVKGAAREGKAPAFCAGGDIRFFHEAAWRGDQRLDDFFTEEYALNHLIHAYPKPYVALMDGIVMGGGMGISQGAALRIVTDQSKLAMPETLIGLFPDVGGGWFLSRCPGHVGEYLALTGEVIGAADALSVGLADRYVDSGTLPDLISALWEHEIDAGSALLDWLVARTSDSAPLPRRLERAAIDAHFGLASVDDIMRSLRAQRSVLTDSAVKALEARSPTMLVVSLEQIRRARTMSLADDLRMERGLVHQCFHLRGAENSDAVEGIRALAVDKDHAPRWKPPTLGQIDADAVNAAYFAMPWPEDRHPLKALG